MTQCASCGVGCQSTPVYDNRDLARYFVSNCTVLVGDLKIGATGLLIDADLKRAFALVDSIKGGLVIRGTEQVVSLGFFSKLRDVSFLNITNNIGMIDARLPSLQEHGNLVVEGNNRLCANRFPKSSPSLSQLNCANLEFVQYAGIKILSANQSKVVESIKESVEQLLLRDHPTVMVRTIV